MARGDIPLAERKGLSWDDLYQYDWLLSPPATPIRNRLDTALSNAGRGLLRRLDFELEAEGSIGMCWRDEPHIEGAVLDLLESLREAARSPIRKP